MIAKCTWGGDSDVTLLIYDDPVHQGSINLSSKEAIELAQQLLNAAKTAKEFSRRAERR